MCSREDDPSMIDQAVQLALSEDATFGSVTRAIEANDKRLQAERRLEYLRSQIEAERISYGEIAELQDLIPYIDPSDVVLLEWAGVPEFPEDDHD